MQLTIPAKLRNETGRKTNILRAEGSVPAVVYGFEIEPTNITIDRNEMERMYKSAGESTILTVDIDGKTHEVLIQDVQRDALTGFFTHVDFRKIDMTKKVEAEISLTLVGEAPAVKELGGSLIQSLEEVQVEALPNALVREIEVDVSQLATFDDVVHVKDLIAPAGIDILTDENRTIASVQPPRSEEEMAALEEEVTEDVDAVEVTSEKKEGEESEGEESQKDGKEEATKA